MKKIILICIFLMISGCKDKGKETKLASFTDRDISEIVETILIQDSLPVFKNDKNSKSLCVELIKINIEIPVKRENNLPPIPFNNITINKLLSLKIENERFFLSTDSIYLTSQNSEQKIFSLEQKVVAKINSTTNEKEISKQKRGEKYEFYEMTIPLFSKDRTKAYVELNHYCGSLCGSGKAILLSKINGKWSIVDKYRTWIS
jgi:hypothetical protein